MCIHWRLKYVQVKAFFTRLCDLVRYYLGEFFGYPGFLFDGRLLVRRVVSGRRGNVFVLLILYFFLVYFMNLNISLGVTVVPMYRAFGRYQAFPPSYPLGDFFDDLMGDRGVLPVRLSTEGVMNGYPIRGKLATQYVQG